MTVRGTAVGGVVDFEQVVAARSAELRLRPGAGQVLVSAFSHQVGPRGVVRVLHDGRPVEQMSAGGASQDAVDGTGGDTVTLRNVRGRSRLALATYERVD